MATSSIIGPEVLPVIQKALSDLDTAEQELELARRAGLFDLPQGAALKPLVDKVTEARKNLIAIRQVYFPGQ